MKIDSTVIRELVLKQHEFRSELSNADALLCVSQFAALAATGFPVVAGFTMEEVPDGQKGIQVVFPDYGILSQVTKEDMREVEKRLVADYDWGSAAIERGSFYNGFKGRSFRLILLY